LRLKKIKSLFLYCRQQGYISSVPCERLLLKTSSLPSEEREVYTTDELHKWFSNLDKVDIQSHPERLWIPLLMLYGGLRQNETIQLTKSDIIKIDDIDCISINNDNGKSLKTAQSKRLVPVRIPAMANSCSGDVEHL
jgi:integrase